MASATSSSISRGSLPHETPASGRGHRARAERDGVRAIRAARPQGQHRRGHAAIADPAAIHPSRRAGPEGRPGGEDGGRIEVQLPPDADETFRHRTRPASSVPARPTIGASTLTTLSGDVPILDGVDLAGLAPGIGDARRIAEAMLPVVNKDLERFGARLMVIYPFPAQVVVLPRALHQPGRPEGPQDPHLRQFAGRFLHRAWRPAGLDRLPRGLFGAGARRGGLRHHRHRQRRRRALAGGDDAHLQPAGVLGAGRLHGQPRLVEQAGSAGARGGERASPRSTTSNGRWARPRRATASTAPSARPRPARSTRWRRGR